jgi:hypothetical protein
MSELATGAMAGICTRGDQIITADTRETCHPCDALHVRKHASADVLIPAVRPREMAGLSQFFPPPELLTQQPEATNHLTTP